MCSFRRRAVLILAVLLAPVAAEAQQRNTRSLHVGYVYPAGGKQGTTFEAVVGGQLLTGVNNVYFSGGGVQATVTELVRPMTNKERNELRIQLDELMAKKAVALNDFRALERFRSVNKSKSAKGTKDTKPDGEAEDEELEALKRKYAGAKWTLVDEKMLSEVRKKLGAGVRRPANPAIGEIAVLRITVAPDAKPGERELRVATPIGLSNPLTFCVGSLSEFSEAPHKSITEQKSAVAKTAVAPKPRGTEAEMEVTLPAVINGQILPGEVDRYRFTAGKGQRLVVAARARELMPYIADAVPGWFQATLAIYDAQGKELAYDDDYRFDPDPVLHCRVPADGQYVLEIKDAIYRGREDFVYRITIGQLPFVTSIFPLGGPVGAKTTVELEGWNLPVTRLTEDATDKAPGIYPISVCSGQWTSNAVPLALDTLPDCREQEPNDDPAHSQQLALPLIVNGRIDRPDDCDVFRIEGRAGSEIVAEVYARRLGSPLDSILRLTDATGRQLAVNDDHDDKGAGVLTHQADSLLRATLPADGTYYVHLGDMQHQGGPEYAYRLRISAPRPDFALRVVPSSISARGGTTVPLTVFALRKDGFSGEIALLLKGAPEGFALDGARIPAGQDQARLTLKVPPLPSKEPLTLHLEGRATIEGRTVSHPAVPAEDMMQAFAYQHLVPAQELKIAVVKGVASRSSAKKKGKREKVSDEK